MAKFFDICCTGINHRFEDDYDTRVVEIEIANYSGGGARIHLKAEFRCVLVGTPEVPILEIQDCNGNPIGHVPFEKP